jgi:LPS-assembly lipoprotein
LYLLLSGCGFHLRGMGAVELAPELRVLRVQVQGARSANDPLLESVRNALREQAGVTVQDGGDVALLELSGEHYETRVASVSTTVKAAEYLVLYDVTFQVTSADGKSRGGPETIRLQRDYSFDPLNVLAKEREEQELHQALRRDAVQQILRRLTKMHLKPIHAGDQPS